MAAPNLRSPTVVTGKSACAVLTTVLSEILGNVAASGKVLKRELREPYWQGFGKGVN